MRTADLETTSRARDLRARSTDAEARLWSRLRDRRLDGLKFVRQASVGPYFADFLCREARLIVELDGVQHEVSAHDSRRDAWLAREGYSIVRLWNWQLSASMDEACDEIRAAAAGGVPLVERFRAAHATPTRRPSSGAARCVLPVNGEKETNDGRDALPSPRLRGEGGPKGRMRGGADAGRSRETRAFTIGLIGGASWESTAVYYRLLNEGARARRGGLSSARIVMLSMDFAPLAALMARGEWDALGERLADEARRLDASGADCVALCTNTMHKVADAIRAATALPFLDIRDVTARALLARGVRRPLLLATRYTMEDGFFLDRLRAAGLDPLTPDTPDRDRAQAIIFDELCLGRVEPASKAALLDMIARGLAAGADSVVLGCTELMLLIGQGDVAAPVFDTTALHVEACLDAALPPA